MGLPKEIEDRITQFATRCFSRGEIGARNSDPSRERDALVSAITHALTERDARIAELEAALEPFARWAEAHPQHIGDGECASFFSAPGVNPTVADVRRARALLAKGGGK